MKCLCIILIMLFVPAICHADEARLQKFDDLKFSIECRQGYEAKRMAGAFANTVGVVLSREAENKKFKPNIAISSTPNSNPPADLDTFFNLNLLYCLKDPNFRLLLAEKTKMGDKEIYQLVYKQKAVLQDSNNTIVPIKVVQVYVIGPSRVYFVNYSAAEDDFNAYLAAANEIINSFKIL